MYKARLEAQLAAIDAVRPGVTAGESGRGRPRSVLKGMELDAHSCIPPATAWDLKFMKLPASARRKRPCSKAGMAITIEPGVYIEGFGGVRIEDTVLVTDNGCEVLTPTSKEFITPLIPMTNEEIKELLQIFNESGVGEWRLQRGENMLRIRRIRRARVSARYELRPCSTVTTARRQPRNRQPKAPATPPASQVLVKSPIVGTYYERPSPARRRL